MRIYHYTKSNRLNSIFEDGFIATEKKRSLNPVHKNTDYVWLTEKPIYPKTALPMLSMFAETLLTTHLRNKGVVVDLGKIGKVFGNFYRFSFDSSDERLQKWFYSEERKIARNSNEWVNMESVANKVGDDIRSFWFSTNDLMLENFSLEVFENGQWNMLLLNASLSNLTDEEIKVIDAHTEISRQKCIEFGIPVTSNPVKSFLKKLMPTQLPFASYRH